ncbi:heterokaryon incompatibility protein [Tricladium varicosporioides]|nr:heterokaryon incompatibility protein [Hymenoscyphus varicosporioides]
MSGIDAQPFSPLRCRIFWTSLTSYRPFKALSYTWGSGGQTHKIYISGKEFSITESLEVALRHLRDAYEPVTLWIDQICINQNDDIEKNEQVAHMNQIYRLAEEVLVWLGPAEDKSSDDFMDTWNKIGTWAEDWGMMSYYTEERYPILRRIKNNADPQDAKTIAYNKILTCALPLFDEKFLNAMITWHKWPWFSRVWVLQEFSLACTAIFICGNKRVKANKALLAREIFDDAVGRACLEKPDGLNAGMRDAVLKLEHDPSQVFYSSSQRRKALDAGSGQGDSLYQLLQKLYVDNKMRATEPCDTIYGLLAVANDTEKLQLRADYTLKHQTDIVYIRTAKAIIASENLDILALSQYPKKYVNLPSWVPDWTSDLHHSFAGGKPLFTASKGCQMELLSAANERVLGITGFMVDEVEEVGGIWSGEGVMQAEATSHHHAYLNLLAQVKLMCLLSANKNKDIYPSLARRVEALWRIPVGDIELTEQYEVNRATSSFADSYKDCLSTLEHVEEWKAMTAGELKIREKELHVLKPRSRAGNYRLRMREMGCKRPFLSKLGYVGMGPLYMRPKDIIVVFTGSKIPYIARQQEEKTFRLIGECYCDGIMDGEIVPIRTKEAFFLV